MVDLSTPGWHSFASVVSYPTQDLREQSAEERAWRELQELERDQRKFKMADKYELKAPLAKKQKRRQTR
jgi:hypothetical protein